MLLIGVSLFAAAALLVWYVATIQARTWAKIEDKISIGVTKMVTVSPTQQKAKTAKESYLATFQGSLETIPLNDDFMIYAINQTYDDVIKDNQISNKNDQLIKQLGNEKSIKLVAFPSRALIIKENENVQAITFSKDSMIVGEKTYVGEDIKKIDIRLKGYSLSWTGIWPFTAEEADLMLKAYFPTRTKMIIEGTDKYLLISPLVADNQQEAWNMYWPLRDGEKSKISLIPKKYQKTTPPTPTNDDWTKWNNDPVVCVSPDEYQVKLPDGTCVDALYLDDNGYTVKAYTEDYNKYDVINKTLIVPTYWIPWEWYRLRADNQWYYLAKNNADVIKILDSTDHNKPALNRIVTTRLINFSNIFKNRSLPNNWEVDIQNWDTSNGRWFNEMFANSNFNGEINGWDVGFGKYFQHTFYNNKTFNKPLNNWKFTTHFIYPKSSDEEDCRINECTNPFVYTVSMFQWATKFNQPLNNWNTKQFQQVNRMFEDAKSFNQDISSWDTWNFDQMAWMFKGAIQFNQDLSKWNVDWIRYIHNKVEYDMNTPNWESNKKPNFRKDLLPDPDSWGWEY